MCKVGYIDDDKGLYESYQEKLRRLNIDLVFCDSVNNSDIIRWILHENIMCLIVDHRLSPKYSVNGTKIVAFINSQLPDLPCIILTNYQQDSRSDDLVMQNLIEERTVMERKEYINFADKIKQFCRVFKKRLDFHQVEYAILLDKKMANNISSDEDERFGYLFNLLKAYGEIDDIPKSLLEPEIDRKMDVIIEKLNRCIARMQ